MVEYSLAKTILLLLAGAFGAVVKDCVYDNKLTLPRVEDGALVLGFVGGAIIGALAGLVIDGSLTTAALAGYTGKSVIESLIGGGNRCKDNQK